MARGLSKWRKALDLKPWVAKLFFFLERRVPALTTAIGYFSRVGPPKVVQQAWVEEHPLKLAQGSFRALYDEVAKFAVDSPATKFDPFTLKTHTWIVDNLIVPGHTVVPVEAKTRKVVSAASESNLKWGFAFPAPVFLRRVAVEGIVCPIPPFRNYYHLLIDHLLPTAFALIARRDSLSGRPVKFVVRKPVSCIIRIAQALTHIGIQTDIITIGPAEHISRVPGFLAFTKHVNGHYSHGYWPGREAKVLFDALDEIIPKTQTSALVYVPRTETRVRKLTNEVEFAATLNAIGFASFVARWSNFDDQFRTFSQAREIVAVHGAGLSNVCWSKPGTKIVEIMPTNARRSHFLQIGSEQGVEYRVFYAGAEQRHQNFEIDIEAFLTARRDDELSVGEIA